MGTFSTIAAGVRARKRVTATTIAGDAFACDLRPMVGDDDALALQRAREFAQARGVAEPREGEPIYELALAVESLAIACVDPDDAAKPFFDGGAAQIRAHLDRDRILYLYETLTTWQASFSPREHTLDWPTFVAKVYELATAGEADADAPFARWAPAMRESFTRTLARLWWSSLGGKSPSGTDSESLTSSAPSASASGS